MPEALNFFLPAASALLALAALSRVPGVGPFLRAHGVALAVAAVLLLLMEAFPAFSLIPALALALGVLLYFRRLARRRAVARGKALPPKLASQYAREWDPPPISSRSERPAPPPFAAEAARLRVEWGRACVAAKLSVPDRVLTLKLREGQRADASVREGLDAVLDFMTARQAEKLLASVPGAAFEGTQVVRVPLILGAAPGHAGPVFEIEHLAGLTLDDYGARARQLADALRVPEVDFTQTHAQLAAGRISVEAILKDPLRGSRDSTPAPAQGLAPVRLGRLRGGDLSWSAAEACHTAIQGATRSGKSELTYGLLSAFATRPEVLVTGVDPSRVLLSPWVNRPGADLRVVGSDPEAAASFFPKIVALMEERLLQLEAEGVDKLDAFTPDRPVVLVVLDEYPGLLEALSAFDAGVKPAERLRPRAEGAVARLLREGAKVGIRVILISQRMDASIVGGASRSQLGYRITLRVDNLDGVRMLHETASSEDMAEVVTFPPGRALAQAPGLPLTRAQIDRTPYSTYRERVFIPASEEPSNVDHC